MAGQATPPNAGLDKWDALCTSWRAQAGSGQKASLVKGS